MIVIFYTMTSTLLNLWYCYVYFLIFFFLIMSIYKIIIYIFNNISSLKGDILLLWKKFTIYKFFSFFILFLLFFILFYIIVDFYRYVIIIFFIRLWLLWLFLFYKFIFKKTFFVIPNLKNIKLEYLITFNEAVRLLFRLPTFWSYVIVNILINSYKSKLNKFDLYTLSKVISIQIIFKVPFSLFLEFINIIKFLFDLIDDDVWGRKSYKIWYLVFFNELKYYFIFSIGKKANNYLVFFSYNESVYKLENRKLIKFDKFDKEKLLYISKMN